MFRRQSFKQYHAMRSSQVRNKSIDINRFLSELYASFTIINDLEQLKDNFSAKLKEVFNTEEIHIFLLHPDLNRFLPIETLIMATRKENTPFFLNSDKLIFWLSVNKTFLEINRNNDILAFLSQREQDLLVHLNAEIIYPFIVMNQVKGLVCIGKKTGHHQFSDDPQYLKVLLDQAGFAFENAYHYHLQKERTRKMYRADRLATLGELAAGAAHEIRNPLTSIRSSIQFLKKKLTHPNDIEMAEDLITEVDRINEIIEGMLSFAKPQEPKKEEINLKSLLNQTVQLIANTARKNGVEVILHYQSASEAIIADHSQLKQVFLNIIINAIQSIDHERGLVTIDVNDVSGDNKYAFGIPAYIIEIADNGNGIEQDKIDRIFDPFFTTKSDGTGLGLSISYGIVNKHGGEIELTSEVNKGTKVKIKLPVN